MNQIKKYAPHLLILCLIAAVAYLIFRDKPQPVTIQSQQTAETPAGIKQAADNARVQLLQDQLNDAARQIAQLKNKPPDTVVRTVVQEVPVVVERERVKSGADFAIVTNPKHPDQQVDLDKLPTDESVTLNQYNVHAYKKILRGINYYPKRIDDWTPQEITVDWSRKISNDGKYLGVVVGYEFDQDKAKVGVRYTF